MGLYQRLMNKLIRKIPPYIHLILKLILFYVIVFFCCRLFFYFFNLPKDNAERFLNYLNAFIMGVRFDLIIVAFLLTLPALILFLQQFFLKESRAVIRILKIYLIITSALVFFIDCADVPYFSQFGSHINKSVMVWKMSPGYALKLIFSSFYYWGFSLLFLFFFVFYVAFVKVIFREYLIEYGKYEKGSPTKIILNFLILGFILFAFARGRLASKSTMHEGMAIVSQNAFVNQIALNPNFTLIKSLSKKPANTDYLKNIQNDLKICSTVFNENYFPENGILKAPIRSTTPTDSLNKLNIIVVLMESLNMSKMGYYGNKNLSPYLTKLAKESVFFDRFFSSGIHTFNGLFSTASGFPNIYTEQGLRNYTRQPFTTLANLLKPYGYRSYFCTTHDAVFDNMEGFFKLNGYDHIISETDFSISESIGVTGVPDHLLYKKIIEKINTEEKDHSFVMYVMTGTDHGPWKIPNDIPYKPNGNNAQENASMYADWSVGQFIEEAKKEDWYKNTVFVFLGDHGQIMHDPYEMPITYHHIPFIVHCPKKLKSEVNHHLGYQPDIVKTLSSLLNLKYLNFSFGENIFVKQRSFVFFSADDKLGYVTDDDFFFYHTLSDNQRKFVKYQNLNKENYYEQNKGRADSLYNVVKSLYNSAQYFIRQNYFSN